MWQGDFAAQYPRRAKGSLSAQHRAPNRCSRHAAMKRGCAALALGDPSSIICWTVTGYMGWGGTCVLGSEAPTCFWHQALLKWLTRMQCTDTNPQGRRHTDRSQEAQSHNCHPRRGAYDGGRDAKVWTTDPDTGPTKKIQPLGSHRRVSTEGGKATAPTPSP